MNEQEAIKAIRPSDGLSIEGKALRVAQFIEGLAVATEALEKQVAKKLVLKNGLYHCPCCDMPILSGTIYCSECGQKIRTE